MTFFVFALNIILILLIAAYPLALRIYVSAHISEWTL